MSVKSPEKPVLRDFNGDLLIVGAVSPLPPGSRLSFSLDVKEGETVRIQGKVVYAKRLSDEEGYEMSIRVHSLQREARDALLEAVRPE